MSIISKTYSDIVSSGMTPSDNPANCYGMLPPMRTRDYLDMYVQELIHSTDEDTFHTCINVKESITEAVKIIISHTKNVYVKNFINKKFDYKDIDQDKFGTMLLDLINNLFIIERMLTSSNKLITTYNCYKFKYFQQLYCNVICTSDNGSIEINNKMWFSDIDYLHSMMRDTECFITQLVSSSGYNLLIKNIYLDGVTSQDVMDIFNDITPTTSVERVTNTTFLVNIPDEEKAFNISNNIKGLQLHCDELEIINSGFNNNIDKKYFEKGLDAIYIQKERRERQLHQQKYDWKTKSHTTIVSRVFE